MTEGSQDIVKPIPDMSKAGWKSEATDIEGNNNPLEATALKSIQTKMGVEVSYGQGPDGYDQWVIKEPNGGGFCNYPLFMD